MALQIAPPVVLPTLTANGHYRRGAGMAVFLTSHGEITALDSHGQMLWQVSQCLTSRHLHHWTSAINACNHHAVP